MVYERKVEFDIRHNSCTGKEIKILHFVIKSAMSETFKAIAGSSKKNEKNKLFHLLRAGMARSLIIFISFSRLVTILMLTVRGGTPATPWLERSVFMIVFCSGLSASAAQGQEQHWHQEQHLKIL